MVAGGEGPYWQQVINDLRARIAAREFKVGEYIPATSHLLEEYRAKLGTRIGVGVVRRAVGELENEGLLKGHSGKGVQVVSTPQQVAEDRRTLKQLTEDYARLRRDHDQLRGEVDDLRSQVDETRRNQS